VGHYGHAFEGYTSSPVSSSFFISPCLLFTMKSRTSIIGSHSYYVLSSTWGQPAIHGLNPPKWWAKLILPLWSCTLRYFGHSHAKVTNSGTKHSIHELFFEGDTSYPNHNSPTSRSCWTMNTSNLCPSLCVLTWKNLKLMLNLTTGPFHPYTLNNFWITHNHISSSPFQWLLISRRK
jgi:hypothetical protein